MKIWNSCWFENLNTISIFFFVFQLYIDLRCYCWSLQTLSLVLLWSTSLWLEREGTSFFFNKLGWHRREKVTIEVFTNFSDLSVLSLQLVTSYFMRIHLSWSSHLSEWGVTLLVVCLSFLMLYHYPSELSILFLSE